MRVIPPCTATSMYHQTIKLPGVLLCSKSITFHLINRKQLVATDIAASLTHTVVMSSEENSGKDKCARDVVLGLVGARPQKGRQHKERPKKASMLT